MPRAVLAALALLLAAAPTVAAAKPPAAEPTLQVVTFAGENFDLGRLKGQVVAVNLWATWCPPCRAEMPALDAVYRARHAAGLAMIGLSADKPRDEAKARAAMAGLTYPGAMLAKARMAGLARPAALPVTFIIDRTGALNATISGGTPLSEARLEAIVAPLLASP